MFANNVKFVYGVSTRRLDDYYDAHLHESNHEIIKQPLPEYTQQLDFKQLKEEIDDTFMWLRTCVPSLTFPLLSRLLDFENPACFACGLDDYTKAIQGLLDTGATEWLLKEAIMEHNNLDAAALEDKVDRLENEYTDKGVVDPTEPAAKGPFVYEVRVSEFSLSIKKADVSKLRENAEWKRLENASNDNYVISFGATSANRQYKAGAYDSFVNVRQIMQYKTFLLVHPQNKHELMHCLGSKHERVQYAATELNDLFTADKLVDYYKQQPIKAELSSDYANDEDEDDGYHIDNERVFDHPEPPRKKLKLSAQPEKVESYQHSIQQATNNQSPPPMSRDASPADSNGSDQPTTDHKKEEEQTNAEDKAVLPKPDEAKPPITQLSAKTLEVDTTQNNNDENAVKKRTAPRRRRKRPKMADTKIDVSSDEDSKECATESVKDEKAEVKYHGNLVIKDGVGWAFGVPIYNEKYYDCADFAVGHKFNKKDFGKLVVVFACKSDLVTTKELRGRRSREIRKQDEKASQFITGVPDDRYRILFMECFTESKREQYHIRLQKYADKKLLEDRKNGKRKIPKFITFEPGFGIKKDMVCRLYLLLRIYRKHITEGCININDMCPPWVENDCSVIKGLNELTLNVVDLTEMDDDDDEDVDVEMTDKNQDEHTHKKVRVKREFGGFEGEYDSE